MTHFSKIYTKEEIIIALKTLKISNYKIHEDLTVDVYETVSLYGKKLSEFPFQFGLIEGDFLCGANQLISLKGAPHTVTGKFSCASNLLTDLVGGPQNVGKQYYCMDNKLITLKGAPEKVETFNCNQNNLTTLEHGPKEVDSEYQCSNNQLITLKDAPKIVSVFNCMNNQLTSLLEGPEQTITYNCKGNLLQNLIGVAQKTNELDCSNNPLISLKGITQIDGPLTIANTNLKEIDEHFIFNMLFHTITEKEEPLLGFENLYENVALSTNKLLSIDYNTFKAYQEKKMLDKSIPQGTTMTKKLKV